MSFCSVLCATLSDKLNDLSLKTADLTHEESLAEIVKSKFSINLEIEKALKANHAAIIADNKAKKTKTVKQVKQSVETGSKKAVHTLGFGLGKAATVFKSAGKELGSGLAEGFNS